MEKVTNQFFAYLVAEKYFSRNTVLAYKKDLEQFCEYILTQKVSLSSVQRPTIVNFLAYLKNQGNTARTISRKISSIKLFFLWAEKKLEWQSPMHMIELPKIEKKLPRVLSETTVSKLLEALERDTTFIGRRNRLMIYLLYVSGARVSELVSIKISHINIQESLLHLIGKRGKERIVPIPSQLLTDIKKYLQELIAFSVQKGIKQILYLFPVFYKNNLKPMSRQTCWNTIQQICIKVGIEEHISPHILRHSIATHLLQRGTNLRALQSLLGHENIATVQIYTHVDVDHLRKIYNDKHPRA